MNKLKIISYELLALSFELLISSSAHSSKLIAHSSKIIAFLLFAFCLMPFTFCTTPPDYPIIPHIEFQSISKTTLQQGFGSEDSVYVTLSFTDGDGDLGSSSSDPTLNLFTFNRLINQVADSFRIPFVPVQGTKNGISGTIQVRLLTTCCKSLEPCKPSLTHPLDTLIYDISIKDRAGHLSNIVSTPPILLRCD